MLDDRLEHKVNTFVFGSTAMSTAGLVSALTQPIVEGSDISQRTGDRITVKKLKILYDLRAATNSQTARVIIFADNLAQGGVPGTADLLDTAAILSGFAPTNLQRNRFKIYYDKVHPLVLTSADERVAREVTLKLNHKVYYSGATSTTGANGKGALFILIISTASVGSYDFSCTTTYTDA
jgi:hypothetical protein